jgi:hypothetical protein
MAVLKDIPGLLAALHSSPLLAPWRAGLCEKLNHWAFHVFRQKLKHGLIEEPAHYCDKK